MIFKKKYFISAVVVLEDESRKNLHAFIDLWFFQLSDGLLGRMAEQLKEDYNSQHSEQIKCDKIILTSFNRV